MSLVVSTFKSPIGEYYLVIDDKAVVRAGFGKPPKHQNIANHPYIKLVEQYFKGDKNALDKIPYRQHGSDFANKTWQAIGKIPYGTTLSYAGLAEKAGNKKAVRASASACGKNNIVLLVPCHRVIKSDGSIGKYAYGTALKQYLLNHESKSTN